MLHGRASCCHWDRNKCAPIQAALFTMHMPFGWLNLALCTSITMSLVGFTALHILDSWKCRNARKGQCVGNVSPATSVHLHSVFAGPDSLYEGKVSLYLSSVLRTKLLFNNVFASLLDCEVQRALRGKKLETWVLSSLVEPQIPPSPKSPMLKQYILEWQSWNPFIYPLESFICQESVGIWEERFMKGFVMRDM